MTHKGSVARRALGIVDPLVGRLALLAQRRRELGVIVLYHRVAPEVNAVYPPLHPDEFDKHCDLLKRCFRVIPLAELLERHQVGQSLAGLCSITFDDGYLDFRDQALPVLDAHGLSAAQFVITESLKTGQAPWDIRLLRIAICGGDVADISGAYRRLNSMPAPERDGWLRERENELPATDPDRDLPEMLKDSDLAEIAAGSTELGAHTVNHLSLAEIDLETARMELTESRKRLRDLGHDVSVVAYPKGAVDPRVQDLAREAGYEAGLAVGNRGVHAHSDRFALPRFDVTDRPAGMLRMELGGTVERLRGLRQRSARIPARSGAQR